MPITDHATPGDYIASELIAAKARGETFQKPALSAFIDVHMEKWLQTHGFYLQGGEPVTPQTAIAAPPSPELTPAEAIYAAYPRKVGKTAALKAINAALKKTPHVANHPAVILEATKQFAKAVALWPAKDREFIPYPATWFNRGSYLDDPKEWARAGAAPLNAGPRDYSKI